MTETDAQPEHPEDPDSPEDEASRKFRAALERKRAREDATAGGRGGKDAGKVAGAHGPAGSRRSFRRRGGG
ncbi:MAG: DUF5302 domain-containing protein [Streptosporangiaceae bacterium]